MSEAFDKDGNPIEVLSEEDISRKIEEAETKVRNELTESIENIKKEYEEKVKVKEEEIEDLKDDLEGDDDQDKNWKKVRKMLREAKKEKEELKKTLDEKINEIKGDIGSSSVKSKIKNIAGGNKELEDKINYYYDQFGGKPSNDKEISERIDNAVLLATGSKPKTVLNGSAIRVTGGVPPVGMTGGKISEDAKSVANKLGITEEELKKSGNI